MPDVFNPTTVQETSAQLEAEYRQLMAATQARVAQTMFTAGTANVAAPTQTPDSELEQLLTFLYGKPRLFNTVSRWSAACTWSPYHVFMAAGPNESPHINHWPPAETSGCYFKPSHVISTGLRGLMVNDLSIACSEQKSRLLWVGIDIDAEHNPDHGARLTSDVVTCLGHVGTVRLSKSGKGCHVFIRCSNTSEYKYDYVKRLARHVVQPYVERLIAAGIKPCVHGLPNLWVQTRGGLQRTIHENTTFKVDLSGIVLPVLAFEAPGSTGTCIKLDAFNGLLLKLVMKLQEDKVLGDPLSVKTNVNVGRVRRSLEPLGVKFETQSKCRLNHADEVNGFIELDPCGGLCLVSNPDNNKCIFRMNCL
jgi:hypothetical protein